MAHQLTRLKDDAVATWQNMPKLQAMRWYGAVVSHGLTIVRDRNLYSADHEMRGMLHFSLLGREFHVDNTTPGTSYPFLREFFVRQIYFRAFKQLSFDTCLDLGCNIGEVSGFLMELAGTQGKVVGIDPLTYPENAIRTRVGATAGITIHQGVLCGESVRNDSVALHAICDPYDFDVKLAITIAELVATYQLGHIDFLKMDVEGAEFSVFRDSAQWLDGVDNLAMEVHHSLGDPSEIILTLQGKGFQVKWLDDAGYPVKPQRAGYIYASKVGSLKN